MFVCTLNKKGLKRAAAAVGCATLIALCAFTVNGALQGENVLFSFGSSKAPKVESTDDMVTYLLSFGLEADLSTAKVDQVKVPKTWDASFEAFHEVIKQSGLDLSGCKGKTVEKWEFVVPALSNTDQTVSAILLVRNDKVVGGYLISRPSGEVSALQQNTSSDSAASQQTVETAAQPQQETSAGLTDSQKEQIAAAGEAVGLTPEQIEQAAAAIEEAAAQTGALPTE